jgi:hypothetical protein
VTRTLRLSDQSYERLLRQSRSFDDTAEDVIARLLDVAESRPLRPDDEVLPKNGRVAGAAPRKRGDRGRAAPGSILPEREYWPAILATLNEAGGSAHANDVIESVGVRLKGRLHAADLEDLEIGEVRWRNRTRFARLRMKEAGLLRADSPRGVWEITDRGRDYLARLTG